MLKRFVVQMRLPRCKGVTFDARRTAWHQHNHGIAPSKHLYRMLPIERSETAVSRFGARGDRTRYYEPPPRVNAIGQSQGSRLARVLQSKNQLDNHTQWLLRNPLLVFNAQGNYSVCDFGGPPPNGGICSKQQYHHFDENVSLSRAFDEHQHDEHSNGECNPWDRKGYGRRSVTAGILVRQYAAPCPWFHLITRWL